MANSNDVKRALVKFRKQIDRANKNVEDVLDTVRDLEKVLEAHNADADLQINRSLRAEINRGKKRIDELRKNVDKLNKELADTKRKYHYLTT